MNTKREKREAFEKWFEREMKRLSPRKFKKFLSSSEYLQTNIDVFGFENSEAEIKELNQRNREEAKKVFEQALDIFKDEQIAEQELIKLWVIPPSFTSTFDCPMCGTYPAKPDAQSCAWCEQVRCSMSDNMICAILS